MNRHFKPVVMIGIYLLMLFAIVLTQAISFEKPKFSRFILFGDSLTDTGKMYDKSLGTIPADHPPLQWSTPLYYDGRFSNGPIWIDHLKSSYDMGDAQVINEAEGGATMYDYMSKSFNPTYWVINTLNYEVSQFLTKVDKNKVLPVNNNDMVIIWIGGNDLLTFHWLSDEDIYDDMSKLYLAVDTLVMAGVKNFVILNLPELVMTPNARDLKQSKQDKLEHATNKFNEQIELATKSMSAFYTPSGVKIQMYDMMSLFHDALTYPEKYGLTDTRHACYTGSMVGVTMAADGNYTHSVRKLARQWNVPEDQLVAFLQNNPVFADSMQWFSKEDELNGVEMHAMDFDPNDCAGHLFFDTVHPTTEVHQIAGDHLYEFIQENWDYQDLG
ncbi:SGNH/GDSL hydrolase family protein [Thiotrichales bacterium 19S9-12]|nr:SGNH/GDSL hydrolase family protein [Thiotrichales bacterium 19S9-11]MCF6812428.1 SGNH/GDSL hydrolase family protein [Thiotrichales bacterium 19S9-12]